MCRTSGSALGFGTSSIDEGAGAAEAICFGLSICDTGGALLEVLFRSAAGATAFTPGREAGSGTAAAPDDALGASGAATEDGICGVLESAAFPAGSGELS